MARIRTVKPEFWSHPKVCGVSRDARLMFLGLLNEADDEGKLRWSAKRIAGVVFPFDDDAGPAEVDAWTGELEQVGLVQRYEVDGAALMVVVGFTEHQRVSHPAPSRLPNPPETPHNLPESFASSSGDAPEMLRPEGKGTGKGYTPLRGEVWDALVEIFGEASTTQRRTFYGKTVSDLIAAGANAEQVLARGRCLLDKGWNDPSPAALLKHWDALAPPKAARTAGGIPVD